VIYLLVAKRLFGLRGGGAVEQAEPARDNGWAVGGSAGHTVIEHWDGANWARGASPGPGVSSGFTNVAATSASNVWAVGSYHVVPHDLTLAVHCT
jgi:hypothetical protein